MKVKYPIKINQYKNLFLVFFLLQLEYMSDYVINTHGVSIVTKKCWDKNFKQFLK